MTTSSQLNNTDASHAAKFLNLAHVLMPWYAHLVPGLELYAQRLVQETMASRGKRRSRVSQEEFRVLFNALASTAPNVPKLRAETFSREMIYGENA